MSEHTPGPWIVSCIYDKPSVAATQQWFILPADRDGEICEVTTGDMPYEANARLIAAAPDLLEACQTAIRLHDNFASADETARAWLSIRAVIAKATTAIISAERKE